MKKRKERKFGWSRLNRKQINFNARQLESENFTLQSGLPSGGISIVRPGQENLAVHLLERDSEWKAQFIAKQKVKYYYGDLSEKELRASIRVAHRENLATLCYLEKRLDVLVYRLNMATSIFQARSLIKQGFITVNQQPVRKIDQIIQVGSHLQSLTKTAYMNYFKSRLFELQNSGQQHLAGYPRVKDAHISCASHLLSLNYAEGLLLKNPSEKEIYLPLDFNPHKFALYASQVL